MRVVCFLARHKQKHNGNSIKHKQDENKSFGLNIVFGVFKH